MWISIARMSLLVYALMASGVTAAQDTAVTEAGSAPTDSQVAAKSLLLTMATFLADTQRYQVDLRVGYDSVLENGQKVELGERRRLSVERPSYVLDEVLESGSNAELILFDGKWITVNDPGAKVYSRAPQPGDIDTSVKFFVDDLGMRLPLALMLMSQFPEELQSRVVEVDFVTDTDILEKPTTQLAGRTKDLDFQVWISSDRQPLPLRVVLAYREAPGEPRYWVDFSNWKLNPSFLRNAFEFVPPADAEQQTLEAQLRSDPPDTKDKPTADPLAM